MGAWGYTCYPCDLFREGCEGCRQQLRNAGCAGRTAQRPRAATGIPVQVAVCRTRHRAVPVGTGVRQHIGSRAREDQGHERAREIRAMEGARRDAWEPWGGGVRCSCGLEESQMGMRWYAGCARKSAQQPHAVTRASCRLPIATCAGHAARGSNTQSPRYCSPKINGTVRVGAPLPCTVDPVGNAPANGRR